MVSLHGVRQPETVVVGPSNRSFGLVFGVVFLLAAFVPGWRGGDVHAWALGLGLAFLTLAWLRPQWLGPANAAWLRLGLVMHRVVNPVVIAALFYGVLTPFGIAMRLVRRQAGRKLRPDAAVPTYWVPRDRSVSSMKQQF